MCVCVCVYVYVCKVIIKSKKRKYHKTWWIMPKSCGHEAHFHRISLIFSFFFQILNVSNNLAENNSPLIYCGHLWVFYHWSCPLLACTSFGADRVNFSSLRACVKEGLFCSWLASQQVEARDQIKARSGPSPPSTEQQAQDGHRSTQCPGNQRSEQPRLV